MTPSDCMHHALSTSYTSAWTLQAPAGVSGQAQSGGQPGMSQQASSQQQTAEEAGTVSGVQKLETKGDGEETSVPVVSRGQSYGNLSQEVKCNTFFCTTAPFWF